MVGLGAYIVVGLVAMIVTAGMTPVVRMIARRKQWLALPNERTVHSEPTPNIGGVAMFIGVVVALIVAWQMNQFSFIFEDNSEPIGVVVAATAILVVGTWDDIKNLSAPARVVGIIVTALIMVFFGITMFYFRVPFLDVFQLGNDWVPMFTVLWLLVMTQSVNLIDGLDGLAAGIVAIASTSFFIYSYYLSDQGKLVEPNIGPLIAIVTLGVCVGFLPYNFNRASIFMGDGGSYLLGLLMAISTTVVGGRTDPSQTASSQTYFFLAPLFIPLIILGVPIFDVVFAVLRRVRKRQGFATADKGHLHHRLINLGHGPRRSVAILWLWTALLSAFVLYPVFYPSASTLAPFGLIALVLFLYTVLHPDLKKPVAIQEKSD
jgi:UDP-GlcNAc:undecaprenyl-phosphate/decaprenyl-phosphate GlcNAc-1-phosphate transferase